MLRVNFGVLKLLPRESARDRERRCRSCLDQCSIRVDQWLDYIFPTNELLVELRGARFQRA